jgi:DNA-binding IclR family transcriptional regulator
VAGGSRTPGVSVTSRALGVLDAFDDAHPQLSLTEIARRSGLALSTAHRLVGELEAWQGLARRPDGRYEIGRRIWDLGLLASVHRELREVALPFMQDVFAATRENVHLAVLDGASALYVERISGHQAVPVLSRAGSRLPLHATGVGKALLAHAPVELQEQVLASLVPVTEHTITDPVRLRGQLEEVRRRGFARTTEEMSLGTSSLAVPVLDPQRRPIAALGLVVAGGRRDLSRLAPALQVAARAIARGVRPYA